MKRTVNRWCFLFRTAWVWLLITTPLLLCAQEDSRPFTRDTVQTTLPENIFQPVPLHLFPEKNAVSPLYPIKQRPDFSDFSLKEEIRLPYQTNFSPLFRGDFHTNGLLKQFPNGAVLGAGEQTTLPGIGRINEASLGYRHAFNQKLALQLQVNAMKINMPHTTGQAFSTSGTLFYRPSERVTFKFFGSYDIGNSYGMSTHLYGATMSVDMSDRFGMEMGVQRYYDAGRRRWETVPVVIPYYHFDKFTLGLDVGGIMYEILRNVVFEKQKSNGPTMAPPRFSMPIR